MFGINANKFLWQTERKCRLPFEANVANVGGRLRMRMLPSGITETPLFPFSNTFIPMVVLPWPVHNRTNGSNSQWPTFKLIKLAQCFPSPPFIAQPLDAFKRIIDVHRLQFASHANFHSFSNLKSFNSNHFQFVSFARHFPIWMKVYVIPPRRLTSGAPKSKWQKFSSTMRSPNRNVNNWRLEANENSLVFSVQVWIDLWMAHEGLGMRRGWDVESSGAPLRI